MQSERKLFFVVNFLLDLHLFWLFCNKMQWVPIDINRFGIGGAGIFAGAAANTDVVVDFRDIQLFLVRHHVDGFGGAVLGAGAAYGILRVNDAILFDKIRFTYMERILS